MLQRALGVLQGTQAQEGSPSCKGRQQSVPFSVAVVTGFGLGLWDEEGRELASLFTFLLLSESKKDSVFVFVTGGLSAGRDSPGSIPSEAF